MQFYSFRVPTTLNTLWEKLTLKRNDHDTDALCHQLHHCLEWSVSSPHVAANCTRCKVFGAQKILNILNKLFLGRSTCPSDAHVYLSLLGTGLQ